MTSGGKDASDFTFTTSFFTPLGVASFPSLAGKPLEKTSVGLCDSSVNVVVEADLLTVTSLVRVDAAPVEAVDAEEADVEQEEALDTGAPSFSDCFVATDFVAASLGALLCKISQEIKKFMQLKSFEVLGFSSNLPITFYLC